ncbi:MAG: HK97-gp10 family putative phage morphogenesis protein [Phenylobacterium sp.]|nr:HK97-gp10 family putative phage morphogenesis protein [Phenylobacterium sp.]
MRVDGLSALNARLAELPKATAKSVLRQTARAALTPMAETARRLAPDDPETGAPSDLKSSIEISPRQKSGTQIKRTFEGKSATVMFMGPTGDGYPQAMIQEFGSAPHVIKPRRKPKLGFSVPGDSVVVSEVQHPGHPAQPYMRPAWEQHKRGALEIVKRELGERIDKAAKRGAGRPRKG